MPHISKKLLEKKRFVDIHNQLYKIILKLSQAGKTKAIFNELLTKTEKIMIAKRLAIIAMLHNRESTYSIENILKVSPSTVSRIMLSYENGIFKELIKTLEQEKGFFSQLSKIIPPRIGRNRFKNYLKF